MFENMWRANKLQIKQFVYWEKFLLLENSKENIFMINNLAIFALIVDFFLHE